MVSLQVWKGKYRLLEGSFEPEGICINHETGFIFKSAEAVSAKECSISVGELAFFIRGKPGFVVQVKWGN